ncbi:MAG: magnesium transporter CorA family protein [Planctomycetota bacterium]|nr:magnesium transporter CorA family protein [Planctomycetota bacterium]
MNAAHAAEAPKLEVYDSHIFFIVHTPVSRAWSQTRRIAVFVGTTWIVTMQRTQSDAMNEIAARVEAAPDHLLSSPDALAHVVIDHMTGGFEGLTAELLEGMTQLEDRVMGDPSPESMQAILHMRRRVIGLLRVTRTQRDVCASLCRLQHPAISVKVVPYLRDVYDHILRVFELLESAREGLAVTRDAYLAVVNNRLSEIMRTLTIIATVMMPLSLIAGIFGMNFDPLPGADGSVGFWLCIGTMLGVAGGMIWWFRRRRWF